MGYDKKVRWKTYEKSISSFMLFSWNLGVHFVGDFI